MANMFMPAKKAALLVSSVVIIVLATCVIAEGLTRLLWKNKPPFVNDEKNLTYRYDAELGWFPIENSSKQFTGTRAITIKHNADGFRDVAHGPKTKKRIAFVGDSYVWGYDVNQEERFTDKLQAKLPDWEVLNMGVSGYGNDQEFILLQKWFDRYKPDIVVLVFCDNDWAENSSNSAHMGYYKPYFKIVNGALVKTPGPVSKSINYYHAEYPVLFKSQLIQMLAQRYIKWHTPEIIEGPDDPTPEVIKQMKNFVEARGAIFKLAFIFDSHKDKKLALCNYTGANYLFLGNNDLYPTNGWHWTPVGHDSVCNKIYDFLALQPH